jgi:hypothetical protein
MKNVQGGLMPVYRVSCEVYDKTWYLRAVNEAKAIKVVKEMTEERGWHLDYPEEPRRFDCKKRFDKFNEVWESRDL